jgi:hypothetical protein
MHSDGAADLYPSEYEQHLNYFERLMQTDTTVPSQHLFYSENQSATSETSSQYSPQSGAGPGLVCLQHSFLLRVCLKGD